MIEVYCEGSFCLFSRMIIHFCKGPVELTFSWINIVKITKIVYGNLFHLWDYVKEVVLNLSYKLDTW